MHTSQLGIVSLECLHTVFLRLSSGFYGWCCNTGAITSRLPYSCSSLVTVFHHQLFIFFPRRNPQSHTKKTKTTPWSTSRFAKKKEEKVQKRLFGKWSRYGRSAVPCLVLFLSLSCSFLFLSNFCGLSTFDRSPCTPIGLRRKVHGPWIACGEREGGTAGPCQI